MSNTKDKELFESYTNEVCQLMRSDKNVQMSKARYLPLYNWTYQFKNDQVMGLKQIFEDWLLKYLNTQLIPELLNSQDFISTFIFEQALFKSLLRYLSILFFNYDAERGSPQLYIVELGLLNFDKLVLSNDTLKQRYKESFINRLNQIRLSNNQNQKQQLLTFLEIFDLNTLAQNQRLEITSIDQQVIIQVRQKTPKMVNLPSPQNVCDNFLFDVIQEATKKFYSELSQTWIARGSSTEYVKQAANQILIEESLREQLYQKFSRSNDIMKVFICEMLEQNVDQIIQNPQDGLYQQFLQLRNSSDLSPILKLYQLYKNTPNYIENQLKEFQKFVQNQVTQMLTESEEPGQPGQQQQLQQKQAQQQQANRSLQIHIAQIDNLQKTYEYCLRLVQNCFEGSHRFRNNMELAFKEKLNQADRFMDKLSIYIHVSLKDKLKETNNEEDRQKFEKFNKNILAFIQFINSKGKLFQKITDNLKNRIFRGEIKNFGYEEEFLKSLRREHPEHLPSDLLTVWKDYKYYRNLDNEIQTLLSNKKLLQNAQAQFTIFTRTNSLKEFNTQNKKDNFIPPKMIKDAISQMELFYQTKQQTEKKQLVWNFRIGQTLINYKFGPSVQQVGKIIVSNLQLFVILYLKQFGSRTKSELLNDTGINYDEELTQQMENLLDLRIIVENEGKFYLQTDQTKLKVQLVPNRPITLVPKKVGENTEDQIMLKKERDLKIQSSIVRLMKTNKEMYYHQICAGVQKGLLGYYDFFSQDILAQIDELINSNYIKRDERINNKFLYTPV
ncbi:unnamed protein product (macronuclear) [Paramecium tetraurelia]|uniref:Cullin family profile domain-containing protein n=1 Tax=Paramecium tetraurelia TaxID=5888 RepID=A0BJA6_PARTE|nr:uncharacterized protein GSPATT00004996001 [Paramecium tetraurelia]CAK58623.1 unnamed protein product [Paramecium tetraurelia]|eukprot:XP_001426021.1 hypothetical protein (macronuclear) [Paramecium tetraurelia strain d4-2]